MSEWMQRLLVVDPDLEHRLEQQEQQDRVALDRARRLHRDIELFQARWPEPPEGDTPILGVTWEQLERQLMDLSTCSTKTGMAKDLVSATRKTARFKPPEMVLREVLCLTWALLDEGFHPEISDPEGRAEMP